MKCLSVAQPWAWAIMHAGKTIENRSWPTSHRGDLLIQASVTRDWLQGGLSELAAMGFSGDRSPRDEDLVKGAIVGVVEVVGCEASFAAARLLPVVHHRWIGNQGWCWVLKNPRPFRTPVKFPGQLSIFDVQESVVREELVRLGMRKAEEQTGGLEFGSPAARDTGKTPGRVSASQAEKLPDATAVSSAKVRAAQGRLF